MRLPLCLALTASSLFCASMTLEEFCDKAYMHSIEITAAKADVKSFVYEKEYVSALEPLTLEASGRKIKSDDQSGSYENSIMLGISLKTPWYRGAEKKSLEAKEKTLIFALGLQKTAFKIGIKKEYLLYLLSLEELAAQQEREDNAKEALRLAKKKFDAGRISNMELTVFEAEVGDAQSRTAKSKLQAEELQESLHSALLSHEEVHIKDLKIGFYDIDMHALDAYSRSSPYKAMFAMRAQELKGEIGVLRSSFLDSVGIGVGHTKEQTQKSIDFMVSVPLHITGKNEKKIAMLTAQLNAESAKEQIVGSRIKLNAAAMLEKLKKIEDGVNLAQKNEQNYKGLYDMALKGFDGGVVSRFEFLAAKNRYFDALLQTVSLKKEYIEEAARLETTLGRVL